MKGALIGIGLVIGLGFILSKPIVWGIGVGLVFLLWLLAQIQTIYEKFKRKS